MAILFFAKIIDSQQAITDVLGLVSLVWNLMYLTSSGNAFLKAERKILSALDNSRLVRNENIF
jgi:hypothetical protein